MDRWGLIRSPLTSEEMSIYAHGLCIKSFAFYLLSLVPLTQLQLLKSDYYLTDPWQFRVLYKPNCATSKIETKTATLLMWNLQLASTKAKLYFNFNPAYNSGQGAHCSLAQFTIPSAQALKTISYCSDIFWSLQHYSDQAPSRFTSVCSFALSTSRLECQPEHQYFFLLTQYSLIHIANPPPASFCLHSF